MQPPSTKTIEVEVVVPVEDMSRARRGDRAGARRLGGRARAPRSSIWPAVEERIVDLVEQHRSTIVFCNSRRLAERLTSAGSTRSPPSGCTACPSRRCRTSTGRTGSAGVKPFGLSFERGPAQHPGASGTGTARGRRGRRRDRPRPPRVGVARAARRRSRRRSRAAGCPPSSRPAASSSASTWARSTSSCRSSRRRASPAGCSASAAPATRSARSAAGVILPKYRGDLVQCAVVAERMVDGGIEATTYPRNPLDVLAQQVVAMCALDAWTVDDLAAVVRRAAPFAGAAAVGARGGARHAVAAATRATTSPSCARASPGTASPACSPAVRVRSGSPSPAAAPSPTAACSASSSSARRPVPRRRARRGDGLRVAGSATSSCSAAAPGGSRTSPTTACSSRPRPGQPGRMPYWTRRRARPPVRARPGARRVPARAVGADAPRARASRLTRRRPRRLRRRQPARLPRRAARGHRHAARRPHDPRRAVPRRARRLAASPIHSPVRRAGQPAVGARAVGAAARELRRRRPVDALRRRHRAAAARDRGGAGRRRVAVFAPDDVEPAVQAEVGGSALFAARFRECAARALLLPRRNPGTAHPAVAAAAAERAAAQRRRRSTARSRSCSRRCARCCRTSSTCPGSCS